jgi:protein-tyrosine-phosphatase
VYENTVQGSPLHRYITQIAASGFTVNDELTGPEDYTKDLLFDMINFMRTGHRETWVEFSEEELKQFFVEEGKDEESQEKKKVNEK